jgi:membrane protein implicated in regulation of membrane protease activity
VTLLIAILLALFLLPYPWNLAVVIGAAVVEVVEATVLVKWSRRRRAAVGVEALIGRTGVTVGQLAPDGQIRIDGELWNARSTANVGVGRRVVVRGVDGLTLQVEPE